MLLGHPHQRVGSQLFTIIVCILQLYVLFGSTKSHNKINKNVS